MPNDAAILSHVSLGVAPSIRVAMPPDSGVLVRKRFCRSMKISGGRFRLPVGDVTGVDRDLERDAVLQLCAPSAFAALPFEVDDDEASLRRPGQEIDPPVGSRSCGERVVRVARVRCGTVFDADDGQVLRT